MIIRSGLDPFSCSIGNDKFRQNLILKPSTDVKLKKPFRLSSLVNDYNDRKKLDHFLVNLNSDYENWVSNLRKFSRGFDQEIKKLILKKDKLLSKKKSNCLLRQLFI